MAFALGEFGVRRRYWKVMMKIFLAKAIRLFWKLVAGVAFLVILFNVLQDTEGRVGLVIGGFIILLFGSLVWANDTLEDSK